MNKLKTFLEIAVLDRQRLAGVSDGDTEFETEIMTEFLYESETIVCNLCVAIESKDAETVRKLAHTLKGSSRSIGAARLGQLSEALEQIGKSGTVENCGEVLVLIKNGLIELKHVFDNREFSSAA